MGTRSNVVVKDGDKTVVMLYRQFDGYPFPPGMGHDLKVLLPDNPVITNGFNLSMTNPTYFNGMGDLAAYLVAGLKQEIGNVYLYPTDHQVGSAWEEYAYTFYEGEDGEVCIRVEDLHEKDNHRILYEGTMELFLPDKLKPEGGW